MGNTLHGPQLKQGSTRFYTLTIAFLIYINDLSDDLASNQKLFADDTSLIENRTKSANDLNNDLAKISTLALQ